MSNRIVRFTKHNATTLLTIAGGLGFIGTVILAVNETPKALRIMEARQNEKGDTLTPIEKAIAVTPVYFPAAALGITSLACIFGANVLNRKQQASLASAYALASTTYKEYRNKNIELFGEEADEKIRTEIAIEKRKELDVYTPGISPIDTKGDTVLFYDDYHKRYFESTMEAIINAEYHFNRNFAMREYATLDEFYGFLGLESKKGDDILGWSKWELYEEYEASFIDFNHRHVELEDGLECYMLEFIFPPEEILEYV